MRETITIQTEQHEELIDITEAVRAILQESSIQNGIVQVYAQGATGAIMIQENWDDSVQLDVVNFLRKLIPSGVW
ncbi:MAG: YjbQ family protein, partial [Nitrospirae bacterium]|nr:YjbQ family protein [Nitrospirota bacterium]